MIKDINWEYDDSVKEATARLDSELEKNEKKVKEMMNQNDA